MCDVGEPEAADGAAVEAILGGQLTIHQLASGRHTLRRLVESCFAEKDTALAEAQRRSREYTAAAARLSRPDAAVAARCLPLRVGRAHAARNDSVGAGAPELGGGGGARRAGQRCHPIQYVVTILPVVLSILLSFRVDLDHRRSAQALEYAAALVDKAQWEYIARVGIYFDMVVLHGDVRRVREGPGGGGGGWRVGGGEVFDATTVRSKALTQAVVGITEQYLSSVANWMQPEGRDRGASGRGTDAPLLASAFADNVRGAE